MAHIFTVKRCRHVDLSCHRTVFSVLSNNQGSRCRAHDITRGHSQPGFTLIELLVTITIIAILVGMVVVNIDLRNVGKTVRNTALRTGLLMELASDQAVYTRQQFGIRFHPESYSFYTLTDDGKGNQIWQAYEDEQLRYRIPDAEIEYAVDISGLPIVLENLEDELSEATDEEPLKPHVIFLSNGEIFPDFNIVVADLEGEFRYSIATGDVLPVIVESLDGGL